MKRMAERREGAALVALVALLLSAVVPVSAVADEVQDAVDGERGVKTQATEVPEDLKETLRDGTQLTDTVEDAGQPQLPERPDPIEAATTAEEEQQEEQQEEQREEQPTATQETTASAGFVEDGATAPEGPQPAGGSPVTSMEADVAGQEVLDGEVAALSTDDQRCATPTCLPGKQDPKRQGETSTGGTTPTWDGGEQGGNLTCPSGQSDTGTGVGGNDYNGSWHTPWNQIDAIASVTTDGTTVGFTAAEHHRILGAIVKGGSYANHYDYTDAPVTSDGGLTAPINPKTDQPFGLSNLRFCYEYVPPATPTAPTVEVEVTKEWIGDVSATVTTGTAAFEYRIRKDDCQSQVLVTGTMETVGAETVTSGVIELPVGSGTSFRVEIDEFTLSLPDGLDPRWCEVVVARIEPDGGQSVAAGGTAAFTVQNTVFCDPPPLSTIIVHKLWEIQDGEVVTPVTPTEGTVDFEVTLEPVMWFGLRGIPEGSLDLEPAPVTTTVRTQAQEWSGASQVLLEPGVDYAASFEEQPAEGLVIPGCTNPTFETVYLPLKPVYRGMDVAPLVEWVPDIEYPLWQGATLEVTVVNVVTCEDPSDTPVRRPRVTPDPEPEPEVFFVAFEKVWQLPPDYAEFGAADDLSVTFAFDGESLVEGQEIEVELDTLYDIGTEIVTGLPTECEVVASDLPDSYATPVEAEDGTVFTITVTNTVECTAVAGEVEDRVEEPVETTDPVEDPPVTETPERPVVEVEVLGVTRTRDDALPATGASAFALALLGMLGVSLGAGLLGSRRRRE